MCDGKMFRQIIDPHENSILNVSKTTGCIEGSFYYTGCRIPRQKWL